MLAAGLPPLFPNWQKLSKMKNIIYILTLSVILLTQCDLDRSDVIDIENVPGELELFAENNVSTNLYERDIAISPEWR